MFTFEWSSLNATKRWCNAWDSHYHVRVDHVSSGDVVVVAVVVVVDVDVVVAVAVSVEAFFSWEPTPRPLFASSPFGAASPRIRPSRLLRQLLTAGLLATASALSA